MCDPITIAGIALTAGSTLANSIATQKVNSARSNVMAAERIRQGGLDREAEALNAQSQDRYQDFGDKQDQKASELGQYFTDQQIEAGNDNVAASQQMVMPQSGSNITVREEAKKRGEAREYADGQGVALGNLRAFGDLLGGIGRDQARDAGQIGQIGGFKRGSSGIVPFELEGANSAGDGMKLFADILGMAGSAATGAGLGAGAKTVDPWLKGGLDLRTVGKQTPTFGQKLGNLFSPY